MQKRLDYQRTSNISLHFTMKPCFGRPPVTLDSRGSNAHHVCCFFDGEAAKVPQLNHACFLFVECRQSFERVVERDEFRTPFDGAIDIFV